MSAKVFFEFFLQEVRLGRSGGTCYYIRKLYECRLASAGVCFIMAEECTSPGGAPCIKADTAAMLAEVMSNPVQMII